MPKSGNPFTIRIVSMGYRDAYGNDVTKDEIFFYVYGLLHSPEYRERFGADLKKMLPRIPKVLDADRFQAFSLAGRNLFDLHIGYEDITPYPLAECETGRKKPDDVYAKYAVNKMKYGGKTGSWDKTKIIYNEYITLEGIPEGAHEYILGSRSAVGWIFTPSSGYGFHCSRYTVGQPDLQLGPFIFS